MMNAELLAALARECPNGVSFDPMAVRLLKRRVPFEDWQIGKLQADMFQLENGLWFSSEMICDDEARLALCEQATAWLTEHRYFSVERLLNDFCGVLSHLAMLEDFAAFLRHLGFSIVKEKNGHVFCVQSFTCLGECLAATSKAVSKLLEEAGGTLALSEIEAAMPHLTAEALEAIRSQFLTEVHATEVGGVPCWCSTEAIPLPEDFSEQLTNVVDTLVALDEKVSAANLEFALNLFYRTRFRREYALPDRHVFMRVCAKYYEGGNDVFPNGNKSRGRANDSWVNGRRTRSPNTRFRSLGIPIGAKIFYSTDPRVSCTVLDDSNQVEYAGRAWAVSALAMHLLGVPSANGFRHFTYEGEVLWERRSRLKRDDNHEEYQTDEMRLPTEVPEVGRIIGLEGQALLPTTWRAFRRAGTDPRVAEWARRVASGESAQAVARDSSLAVSTVKQQISNRRRYFAICEKNGIVPDGSTNV